MSFTQGEMVFLGVLEDAANVALKAVCTQRPRYLHLSSTVSQNGPTVTQVPKLGGFVDWKLDAAMPRIDFFPSQSSWPSSAPPFAIDQFGIHAQPVMVEIIPAAPVAVIVTITGQVQLVPISGGYKLVFTPGVAKVLDDPAPPPIPAAILNMLSAAVTMFVLNFGPIEMVLPPLAIGPIVPAFAPIILNNEFALRGSL